MPAKRKLSPAAKRTAAVAEDTKLIKQAKVMVNNTDATVSENGTKVKIPFMMKNDSYYVMETEKRSRRQSIMTWRLLNDKTK